MEEEQATYRAEMAAERRKHMSDIEAKEAEAAEKLENERREKLKI